MGEGIIRVISKPQPTVSESQAQENEMSLLRQILKRLEAIEEAQRESSSEDSEEYAAWSMDTVPREWYMPDRIGMASESADLDYSMATSKQPDMSGNSPENHEESMASDVDIVSMAA